MSILNEIELNTKLNDVTVYGICFRESVFIFLTNSGGELITDIAFEKWEKGFSREDLELADFEIKLKKLSYNEEGKSVA